MGISSPWVHTVPLRVKGGPGFIKPQRQIICHKPGLTAGEIQQGWGITQGVVTGRSCLPHLPQPFFALALQKTSSCTCCPSPITPCPRASRGNTGVGLGAFLFSFIIALLGGGWNLSVVGPGFGKMNLCNPGVVGGVWESLETGQHRV